MRVLYVWDIDLLWLFDCRSFYHYLAESKAPAYAYFTFVCFKMPHTYRLWREKPHAYIYKSFPAIRWKEACCRCRLITLDFPSFIWFDWYFLIRPIARAKEERVCLAERGHRFEMASLPRAAARASVILPAFMPFVNKIFHCLPRHYSARQREGGKVLRQVESHILKRERR